MNFGRWITTRLKERSTWLGITGAISALGVFLSPDQVEAIITVGVAAAGAIGIFFPDPENTDKEK